MDRPDAQLIRDEFANSVSTVVVTCRLAKIRLATKEGRNVDAEKAAAADELRHVIEEHDRLWMGRNRPGGLSDSRARLENRLAELSS